MQRLFLALWPDQIVRARLESVCQRLSAVGGRVIAPSNLHATLVFLGSVDSARRVCIERTLEAVSAPAFELTLTELAWRRNGGIVWLAAAQVPAPLGELVTALHTALGPCGYQPERRPYRLHVTLARNVRRAPRELAVAPVHWRTDEYCLMSSVATAAGSAYTIERRWKLF